MKRLILLLAPLILGGCATDAARAITMLLRRAPSDLNVPLVQANDQATAYLSVTSCFVGPSGSHNLEVMLQTLTSHGVLVRAEDGATSRLVLNTCPPTVDADLVRAAGEAARVPTQRRGVARP